MSSAPGSSGVVSTFSDATCPDRASSAQKSMKVPPMSTPTFQSVVRPGPDAKDVAATAISLVSPFT